MSDIRRERVESPTFGKGWLLWPGPNDGMRFTFEADTDGSTFALPVRFTMDVEQGVITTDSPRRHRDVERAEAQAEGARIMACLEQGIDLDPDDETSPSRDPYLYDMDENTLVSLISRDPDGEVWFTLRTGGDEVFGFRRISA